MNTDLTNIKCSWCNKNQATHLLPVGSEFESDKGATMHYEYLCDECHREYELKMKYKNLD
jgi:hypothetical protein